MAIGLNPRFVTTPQKRITVSSRLGTAMPQGNDFSPVDPTETVTNTWDFAPWLGTGVTLTGTPTTTCTLRSGVDAAPGTRLIGSPSVVASPSSAKASQAVQQQVSTMQAGASYFLTCVASTSDGQVLTLWAHQKCQGET